MPVYAIAQITILNSTIYERYREQFASVMKRFKGQVLAVDANPQVVEGKWDYGRVVLLSFPDEEAFWEFWNSPEYQEIAQDRKAASTAVILLAKGKD